jgi:hypothetical protein
VKSITAILIERPAPLIREFEIVIMVDVVTGEMLGSD